MTGLPPLILASQSKGRIAMLRGAGLDMQAAPADIDEASITRDLLDKEETFDEIAQTLADQKALKISAAHPGALVIGSDQILEFNGEILGKAPDADTAIARLKEMSGQTHHLVSAVSVALNGEIIWQTCDHAALTMHALDEAFLTLYRSRAADALTQSVGGYWLEDIGSWLFESIDGNYFTILGMPLLPLLHYLRGEHRFTFTEGAG